MDTVKDFKKELRHVKEKEELDILCCKWLECLAFDSGRDGNIAIALLEQVKELLRI